MRRAIGLAHRGAGRVAPNPMVGAVLVHEGRVIGEGWHALYGDVHAEVACLESVLVAERHLVRESTMYVTLEPCAHQGRQPPCAHRLVQEGIPRVVIACEDPFPQVSGRGTAILREAGITVEVGCCREEAQWMCRRFLHAQKTGRPYIILKWAQSIDGYIAPADGSRRQLSNHYSQTLVHRWRTEESAIMVASNTAMADNPQLTARLWKGNQPLRIVLDKKLRIPTTHQLLDDSTATWVVNDRQDRDGITRHLRLPFNEELLPALMKELIAAQKTSLLVEGGAQLLNSFIAAGLWDEARIFTAEVALQDGIPAPLLTGSERILETAVGSNILQVFQPLDSRFRYVSGAIL